MGDLKIFWKTWWQKNPSKFPFYEKVKMLKNSPFVVESFVIDGLFDYDCTLSLVMDGKFVFEIFQDKIFNANSNIKFINNRAMI